MSGDLRKGDWVQVYGQVYDANAHLEDVVIELFSHSDQYHVVVRRNRVVKCSPPIGIALSCPHLYRTPQARNDELIHCKLHDGHGDDNHHAIDSGGAPWRWTSAESVGYLEEKS